MSSDTPVPCCWLPETTETGSFFAGATPEPDEAPRVVGMNHLTDDGPSILHVVDLPANWEVERKFARGRDQKVPTAPTAMAGISRADRT